MRLDEDLLRFAAEMFIVIQYKLEEEDIKLVLTNQARERARIKIRELGWENLRLKDLFLE